MCLIGAGTANRIRWCGKTDGLGTSPGDGRELSYASYVYVTHDFGRTWEAIAGNLPDEPVNAIVEDPGAAGVLFVGTDLGVYASTNAGANWVSLGHNLPTAPVVDLAVQARDDTLVAVTYGLSAFLLPIGSVRNVAVAGKELEHVFSPPP
jgi:ligand-binding sensor domain-containing protein